MHRIVARVLAVLIGLLAVVGFFLEDELLLGIMNVDLPLDVARLVFAIALAAVGFAPAPLGAVRAVLFVVGLSYVLIGVLAFVDPTLFGVLPTGLTAFDIGFHLVFGVGSLVVAFVPVRSDPATNPRGGGVS